MRIERVDWQKSRKKDGAHILLYSAVCLFNKVICSGGEKEIRKRDGDSNNRK